MEKHVVEVMWSSAMNDTTHNDDDERISFGALLAGYNVQEKRDPNHVYTPWGTLPDLVIEKIFSMLDVREKYYASQVCWAWYWAFHMPRSWHTLAFKENMFCRRKFNYYHGWERMLDNIRASMFLMRRGAWIRTLIISPMENFYNLYEFMNLCTIMHDKSEAILSKVHTLRFHFSIVCMKTINSENLPDKMYGTGGEMLGMLKSVVGILTSLRTLQLTDLLLDGKEGVQLLDDVCICCCESLRTLEIVNVTRMCHPLIHPGTFVNLTDLKMSPQNLHEDLLELLGHSKLVNLFIIQNKYTLTGRSLPYQAWKSCRRNNPKLRVHLVSEDGNQRELYWQQRAPVKSIVYASPYARVTESQILQIVEWYKSDLEVFGHLLLPRYKMPKVFDDRIDSLLIMVARQCPFLHTLVIRERVSTATILLLAYTAKNLVHLHVRRNAVVKKMDWSPNLWMDTELIEWMKINSRSYEDTEKEVAQTLGLKRWHFLSDKQFKMLELNLAHSVY